MVVVPAHQDATITTLKALDIDKPALGPEVIEPIKPAGVSATSRVVKTRTERPMRKSYADMITECIAARKEKTDRIDALLTKSGEAGLTLDESEAEDHDTLAAEVVEIDKQLARYRAADEREKAAAAQVRPNGGLEVRHGAQISVTD